MGWNKCIAVVTCHISSLHQVQGYNQYAAARVVWTRPWHLKFHLEQKEITFDSLAHRKVSLEIVLEIPSETVP
jgi:hypothetical protein